MVALLVVVLALTAAGVAVAAAAAAAAVPGTSRVRPATRHAAALRAVP